MDAIVAEDVTRRHRSGRGVDGIFLSVPAGQCLGVLGPNGSGKTTLTRLIAGIDRIERGRLSVLGEPACPRPCHARYRCGVALDTAAHWGSLSGRQNLWFYGRQYGLGGASLRRRVDELLDAADLVAQADEPVGGYSFGMRRKLSIIEALVHQPDLLVLDEPSAGVDAAFLDWMVQYIHRRCERGRTTWVADNDVDWLSRAATDAILLRDGRVEAGGSVLELMASTEARSRVEVLLEQEGLQGVPDIPGVTAFRCERNCVHAELIGNPRLPVALHRWIVLHGGRIRSMEIRSISLHDALARRGVHSRHSAGHDRGVRDDAG